MFRSYKFKNSIEKCKKIREKDVLQSGRNGLKLPLSTTRRERFFSPNEKTNFIKDVNLAGRFSGPPSSLPPSPPSSGGFGQQQGCSKFNLFPCEHISRNCHITATIYIYSWPWEAISFGGGGGRIWRGRWKVDCCTFCPPPSHPPTTGFFIWILPSAGMSAHLFWACWDLVLMCLQITAQLEY